MRNLITRVLAGFLALGGAISLFLIMYNLIANNAQILGSNGSLAVVVPSIIWAGWIFGAYALGFKTPVDRFLSKDGQ